MRGSSLAGRFKVGTRIYFGFLSVLLLLVVVVLVGARGLTSAREGFDDYAAASDDALRILTIDRNVAGMRRIVLSFQASGDRKLVDRVGEIQADLGRDLRAALASANHPERRANLERMTRLFEDYSASFTTVVDLRQRRDRLIREQLNPSGRKLRELLQEITHAAMADQDMAGGARTGLVQEALGLARLTVQRVVDEPTDALIDDVRKRTMPAFLKGLRDLSEQTTDPARQRLLREAEQTAPLFTRSFEDTAAVAQESDRTITAMAALAAEFGDLAAATVRSENESRTATFAASTTAMDTTMATDLAIAVAAVLIGLLMAWVVARSIVRPVRAMTETMTNLAHGDLTVTIPALADKDEIGEMAQAVQVFKDNAIEKQRMDEAERARLEAERQAAEAQRVRERAIGQEITALIDGVSKGDLSRRIDLAGKDGFYQTMSEGINRLTDTVEGVIADLGAVLGALAQGDLNSRIEQDYQGAFQRLKSDVNATSTKLAEIVGQIGQAADAMAGAASEVSLGSTDLAERTEQQASNLEETAASMEELGATVRSNADNAQRANRMAEEAKRAAESGGNVAGSAIEAMRRIEEASRKITDIIGVIDEIAFQTNLLALNAAVEAARAGDAGRGFAVVAQEVRNLAQRSAQASKEIKGLILASDSQVHDGVDLVRKAGDALGGIVSGVQQVASLIAEMASASSEQASALDEINAAVAQMDEMTQKNAALVEETTAAAQAMAGQAGDLKTLVGFFKLDQAASARPAARQAAARPAVQRVVKATRPAPAPAARPAAAPKVAAGGTLRHISDVPDDDWKEF